MKSILLKILVRIIMFLTSVITATVLASLFQTQFVVSDLNAIGGSIDFGERLRMTGYDISHLSRLYGVFIGIGLLIAFMAGGLLYRFAKTGRTLIYVVAGGTCFLVMLYLMKLVFFGVPIIAGARSGLGLAFQALAGGIAGYVFARLTTPAKPADS